MNKQELERMKSEMMDILITLANDLCTEENTLQCVIFSFEYLLKRMEVKSNE
jgi:hypothetical protein